MLRNNKHKVIFHFPKIMKTNKIKPSKTNMSNNDKNKEENETASPERLNDQAELLSNLTHHEHKTIHNHDHYNNVADLER